jgi:hypothetical protein
MTQLDRNRYIKIAGGERYAIDDGLYLDMNIPTAPVLCLVLGGTVVETYTGAGATNATGLAATAGTIVGGNGSALASLTLGGDATLSDGAGTLAIGASKITSAMQKVPKVVAVQQAIAAGSFTDGGAAAGTLVLGAGMAIPAGSRFLACLIHGITGFTGAGNTTCVLTVGDGSDVDRYNTGTPSVYTTAAAGVDMGVPSGTAWHTAAITPTVTITADSDITSIIAGAGAATITFVFSRPV